MHGAASCASSRRVDSSANVPRRAFGVSFAMILKGRLASPWPLVRSSTSQAASELIVQLHSRALATAMLPEPPVYGKERGDVVADTSHFVALGAVVEVDADVQPVTNSTRPANAAVPHRTLRLIANGLPVRRYPLVRMRTVRAKLTRPPVAGGRRGF